MPQPRNETLANHLKTVLQTSSGLDALALFDMEGDEMASALLPGVNKQRLGSMTLALLSLGLQIAGEFDRGKLGELYIKGAHGFILLMPLEERAILVALARENARPGLVLLDLRHMAGKLFAGGEGPQRRKRS
jgi:predicted regulator of Ras-like GTPase activity (Roadblock/LC7/MglB family)